MGVNNAEAIMFETNLDLHDNKVARTQLLYLLPLSSTKEERNQSLVLSLEGY